MIYPNERHGIRGKKVVESSKSNLEFWKRMFFAPAGDKPGAGEKAKKE
jgi:hypothetical protein